MTKCLYCLDQNLDEFDELSEEKWYYSVGYCELCERWYDITMCHNCGSEFVIEVDDDEIIQDFINDYEVVKK